MTDLLIRLYDLPQAKPLPGITVRRALPPERHIILDWLAEHFEPGWISEAALALSQQPATLLVAVRDNELLGFACYDATAKGLFGPTGVAESQRKQGIGEALLLATLAAMREAGYAYAVIGDPGPAEFYKRRLDALEIPNSSPGLYTGILTRKATGPN